MGLRYRSFPNVLDFVVHLPWRVLRPLLSRAGSRVRPRGRTYASVFVAQPRQAFKDLAVEPSLPSQEVTLRPPSVLRVGPLVCLPRASLRRLVSEASSASTRRP